MSWSVVTADSESAKPGLGHTVEEPQGTVAVQYAARTRTVSTEQSVKGQRNCLFRAAFCLEQDDDLQRRGLKNQKMTGHVASTAYPLPT